MTRTRWLLVGLALVFLGGLLMAWVVVARPGMAGGFYRYQEPDGGFLNVAHREGDGVRLWAFPPGGGQLVTLVLPLDPIAGDGHDVRYIHTPADGLGDDVRWRFTSSHLELQTEDGSGKEPIIWPKTLDPILIVRVLFAGDG